MRTGTLRHVTLTKERKIKLAKRLHKTVDGCGRKKKAESYPVVSCMLFSNPQERLQRSLSA